MSSVTDKRMLVAEIIDDMTSEDSAADKRDLMDNIEMVLFLFCELLAIIGISIMPTNPFGGAMTLVGMIVLSMGYLLIKKDKISAYVSGTLFLPSNTYIGDYHHMEQFEVDGWSTLIKPAVKLEEETVKFNDDDIREFLDNSREKMSGRFSKDEISSGLIEELVEVRLKERLDEELRKKAEEESEHIDFLRKEKPKKDVSHLEKEHEDILKKLEVIGEGEDVED